MTLCTDNPTDITYRTMSDAIKQLKTNGESLYLQNAIIGMTSDAVKTTCTDADKTEGGMICHPKQAHAVLISGLYRSLELIVLDSTSHEELIYKAGDIFKVTGEVTAYYGKDEGEKCTPLMFYLVTECLVRVQNVDAAYKNDMRTLCYRHSALFRSIHSGKYLSSGIAKFPWHLQNVEVQLQSDCIVVSQMEYMIPNAVSIGFRGRILSGQFQGFEISVYKKFRRPVSNPFLSRTLRYEMNVVVSGILIDYNIEFGEEGITTSIGYESPRTPAYFLIRACSISGVA